MIIKKEIKKENKKLNKDCGGKLECGITKNVFKILNAQLYGEQSR